MSRTSSGSSPGRPAPRTRDAYSYGDDGGSSMISGVPSTLDSTMYEEIGPTSYASTGTDGSGHGENFVERKDKDGNVIMGANGLPKKWRIKRR
eukprot:CAMPEP_0197558238 /NCGR_PEP_ID=MMETSP1320-20131121/18791_1 /TAXON_ID=91990 /ORGANISM="Bolidomonas sp., Strain RCC2347" /LENGTH=92 /DNA_ID=CAMNT_0043119533 /DNA_START=324 /DNA_END=598 /DNA_ORIENTATION=+